MGNPRIMRKHSTPETGFVFQDRPVTCKEHRSGRWYVDVLIYTRCTGRDVNFTQSWTFDIYCIIARLLECVDCIRYFTWWRRHRDFMRPKAEWNPYADATEWNIGSSQHTRGILHLSQILKLFGQEETEITLICACISLPITADASDLLLLR